MEEDILVGGTPAVGTLAVGTLAADIRPEAMGVTWDDVAVSSHDP